MSTMNLPAPRLTFAEIEIELAELLAFREIAETPEEAQAIDQQIGEYIKREVEKVDGIRRYVRLCRAMTGAAKAEAQSQAQRAKMWEAREEQVKTICRGVMEALGRTRVDGATGYLLLKGNGGVQPLEVTDATLVPNVLKNAVIAMNYSDWLDLERAMSKHFPKTWGLINPKVEAFVDGESVRKVLGSSCPICEGKGQAREQICPDCDGSGKMKVPGARLNPRGSHVEVK